MVLATVPDAPPTTRNQRATSCPAPISAKEPKVDGSRFKVSALRWVSTFSMEGMAKLQSAPLLRGRPLRIEIPLRKSHGDDGQAAHATASEAALRFCKFAAAANFCAGIATGTMFH